MFDGDGDRLYSRGRAGRGVLAAHKALQAEGKRVPSFARLVDLVCGAHHQADVAKAGEELPPGAEEVVSFLTTAPCSLLPLPPAGSGGLKLSGRHLLELIDARAGGPRAVLADLRLLDGFDFPEPFSGLRELADALRGRGRGGRALKEYRANLAAHLARRLQREDVSTEDADRVLCGGCAGVYTAALVDAVAVPGQDIDAVAAAVSDLHERLGNRFDAERHDALESLKALPLWRGSPRMRDRDPCDVARASLFSAYGARGGEVGDLLARIVAQGDTFSSLPELVTRVGREASLVVAPASSR